MMKLKIQRLTLTHKLTLTYLKKIERRQIFSTQQFKSSKIKNEKLQSFDEKRKKMTKFAKFRI